MSTTNDRRDHVVVAVDGTDEGYQAASWSATRATLVGAPLDVVHVLPAHAPLGPFYPVGPVLMETGEGFQKYGREVLEHAREVVRVAAPGLPVYTELLAGGRVHEITEYAAHARLLVVGRREHSRLDQLWTGGTITGVASQASCPVVVAPAGWQPEPQAPRVVAGFKTPRHAAELFAAAFPAAEECGADLVVLHAWRLHSAYDDMIVQRVSETAVNREQKDLIWQLLADFRASYPTVRVRIEVTHETPVHALVSASQSADRLVIVRPAHGGFVHHLGRTARGVLREARCPIEVVPTARSSALSMPPVTLERGGDLVR
jgi:nucleotide-binding universal stress UspA family protein